MQPEPNTERLSETLDTIYRNESPRILATLIRLLGDFDLAEEALHDAFRAAIQAIAVIMPGCLFADSRTGRIRSRLMVRATPLASCACRVRSAMRSA